MVLCQYNRLILCFMCVLAHSRYTKVSNEDIISSNISIRQNMAQIFLLFMPITQESIWLISMPNSAITVSRMHIPPKNTLSKVSGWGEEIRLWSFKQNESDIKLNFVLNSSAYMRKISSTIFFILGSTHFTSENWVLVLFCFLKTMFVLCHQNQIFNRNSMLVTVRHMPA